MLSKIRIDKKFWINLVCFILGGILLVYLIEKYRVAPNIRFADLKLTDTELKPVHLSDYKGKVIFLNFWETWCGPCVQELPTIEKARQQIDSTQMVFITISEENPAKISAFKSTHDYHFQYFISPESFSDLGINTYPTTYIIDKEGKIALTKIGGVDWSAPEIIAQMKELTK
ncbi:MAG TPA: TlpA disulfide reductase family protein [Bacteroidia bacterium]|nr:TlpA disulfide reductase family protein [Bacteroidia bacterium]